MKHRQITFNPNQRRSRIGITGWRFRFYRIKIFYLKCYSKIKCESMIKEKIFYNINSETIASFSMYLLAIREYDMIKQQAQHIEYVTKIYNTKHSYFHSRNTIFLLYVISHFYNSIHVRISHPDRYSPYA